MKKLLFFIQILLVLAMIVLGVLYFIGNKGLLDIIELVLASDLLLMGVSSIVITKNKKYALNWKDYLLCSEVCASSQIVYKFRLAPWQVAVIEE